ncbi:MAG TPA: TorF family putative porin [Nevskiaceae bacterium]|nr:TorF family putative porin [Nevskiaceae bacterium]
MGGCARKAPPVLAALLLCCPLAHAGLKGSAGAVSEYLFRGIESSGGAAVQGDAYYAWDEGYYAGAWLSNTVHAATQIDSYAGYDRRFGDFRAGGGVVYRYFSEEVSTASTANHQDRISFGELYLTGGYGPANGAVYYGHDYFGSSKDSLYVTGNVNLPVRETVSVILEGGYSSGPGITTVWSGRFFDYRASLEKRFDDGFSAGFHVAGTTRGATAGEFSIDNRPKFLVSFKKDFDF